VPPVGSDQNQEVERQWGLECSQKGVKPVESGHHPAPGRLWEPVHSRAASMPVGLGRSSVSALEEERTGRIRRRVPREGQYRTTTQAGQHRTTAQAGQFRTTVQAGQFRTTVQAGQYRTTVQAEPNRQAGPAGWQASHLREPVCNQAQVAQSAWNRCRGLSRNCQCS